MTVSDCNLIVHPIGESFRMFKRNSHLNIDDVVFYLDGSPIGEYRMVGPYRVVKHHSDLTDAKTGYKITKFECYDIERGGFDYLNVDKTFTMGPEIPKTHIYKKYTFAYKPSIDLVRWYKLHELTENGSDL
jgi:hypothetical protein